VSHYYNELSVLIEMSSYNVTQHTAYYWTWYTHTWHRGKEGNIKKIHTIYPIEKPTSHPVICFHKKCSSFIFDLETITAHHLEVCVFQHYVECHRTGNCCTKMIYHSLKVITFLSNIHCGTICTCKSVFQGERCLNNCDILGKKGSRSHTLET
jgi:hypothetical protein